MTNKNLNTESMLKNSKSFSKSLSQKFYLMLVKITVPWKHFPRFNKGIFIISIEITE